MRLKRFAAFLFLSLSLLLISARLSLAKADDLIIMDDGRVILLITDNVLAESTVKVEVKNAPPANAPPAPAPPPSAKTVPLLPAHTQSEIKINPPINNDKKIQVTITTTPPAIKQTSNSTPVRETAPSSGSVPSTSKSAPSSSQPATVINKTVDQVVAKGAGGQTVFTIKSEKANQLTINQEETQVKTSLPLQIDTVSHALSVPSSNGSAGSDRISVLPKEAVQGIVNKGILENKNVSNAKISLTKDSSGSGVNYTVQTEKSGKLFGLIPIKAPKEVSLSAQTGKIVTTPRSVLFNFVGNFIK